MDVLFEKPGRQSGQAVGRSPYLQAVHVEDAAHLIGTIGRVTIDAVFPNSLKGSLIPSRGKVLAH
jgi:tRNA-2-methylthio-N6-dimethylallyladenosine synthase